MLAAGRELIEESPRSRAELAALLAERWTGSEPASLAQAITYLLPAVQVPPRGVWGDERTGPLDHRRSVARPRARSRRPRASASSIRYLAAFGPATVMDIQAWSGLTRLGEVVDGLSAHGCARFAARTARELFDLPDAPRPGPDTPAPPRFLPEYDNLLLSHADRTRFITGGERVPLQPGMGARYGTLLVDGVFRATWRITRERDARDPSDVDPFEPLSDRDAIVEEGERLLDVRRRGRGRHDIRFTI